MGELDIDPVEILLEELDRANENLRNAERSWHEAVVERDNAIHDGYQRGLPHSIIQERLGVTRAVVTRAVSRVNRRQGARRYGRKARS